MMQRNKVTEHRIIGRHWLKVFGPMRDPCGALALVHAGHPVWTRLELAWEPKIPSGCRVIPEELVGAESQIASASFPVKASDLSGPIGQTLGRRINL
jgi:hypothetical protein